MSKFFALLAILILCLIWDICYECHLIHRIRFLERENSYLTEEYGDSINFKDFDEIYYPKNPVDFQADVDKAKHNNARILFVSDNKAHFYKKPIKFASFHSCYIRFQNFEFYVPKESTLLDIVDSEHCTFSVKYSEEWDYT